MNSPAGRTHSRPLIALLLTGIISTGCISEEREQVIGDSLAAEVNPHLPIVDDPLLNEYVQAVGERIGEVSARPGLRYTFYIINTDGVNAFALPGGHIYLTRGLIERTDGAEFAGALAHEIGHVAARHGVRKLQRELRTESLVNLLYTTIFGAEPRILRDNSLQAVGSFWSMRHSRNDEHEADQLAVEYMNAAGVDPRGMVSLLEMLLTEEETGEPGQSVDWFSTHPLTRKRITAAKATISQLKPDSLPGPALDLSGFPFFRALVIRGRNPSY
ncbi:MAG: M48 family metalloprotease [Gemmatimonadota bacterium]|jgi:predicted Zn-dependent protease|nr:M48 family metalloprotease [Gemmatimonadota bacterium]